MGTNFLRPARNIVTIGRNRTLMETDQVFDLPATTQNKQDGNPDALAFDPAEYRHFLDEYDATDAEKDDLTRAIWEIVLAVVDLGFGRHPIQQALAACASSAPDSEGGQGQGSISDIFNATIGAMAAAPSPKAEES